MLLSRCVEGGGVVKSGSGRGGRLGFFFFSYSFSFPRTFMKSVEGKSLYSLSVAVATCEENGKKIFELQL